jgi:hypothetical protein
VACNTGEGISLLSGIPEDLDPLLGLSEVALSIKDANRIIFEVFETACSALNEPSFHHPNWSGPLQLFGDVILKRIKLNGPLQRSLNLSDDQVYNSVWSDTLELVIRIAKIGLEAEYEPFLLRSPAGVLA